MAALAASLSLLGLGILGRVAVRVLEVVFVAGIIGSALVVVITFVEDLKEVFSTDEPAKDVERSVTTERVHV